MNKPRSLRDFVDAALARIDADRADLKQLGFHRFGNIWVIADEVKPKK